jgi:ATP-binding cassette subfamily B protein
VKPDAPHAAAPAGKRPAFGELAGVWSRRREILKLVPRADKWCFAAAVVVMSVSSLLETGIAVLLGQFFDRVLSLAGQPQEALLRYARWALLLLAGAYILKESLQLLRRWLIQRTASRIERDTTCRLVSHLLKVPLASLAMERIGALHGRISRSVEGFVKFLKISFTDFIPAILTALFALGAGFLSDWRVGMVMLFVVPVSLFITVWQVRSQRGIRVELMRAKEGLDGTVVEQLGGIEYIRAADTHGIEARRIEAAAESRRSRETRHHMAMAGFDWVKSLNEGLFHVGIIGFAIVLAARGEIELGKVVTFSFLFLNIMRPLREVHRILDETYESSLQVSVLLGMLNEPEDPSFSVVTLRQPRLDGAVPLLECDRLVVSYPAPDGSSRRILDGVSLSIRHGETIGIAGRSGSGKSTWLRAVLRLVHPGDGRILVGGVPIEALSRQDIGRCIGYVSQTPFVFHGTVRENICYGCGEPDMAAVQEAAAKAHMHDEILALPKGYDTLLGERGGNLSGGQRQRLALARMFLKNPPILILDEGTSALDNISERHVRAAISELRSARTVIMVAHRLTTLNEADRIFVFDHGRVVEEGAYDQLVARGGVFAELVQSAGSP